MALLWLQRRGFQVEKKDASVCYSQRWQAGLLWARVDLFGGYQFTVGPRMLARPKSQRANRRVQKVVPGGYKKKALKVDVNKAVAKFSSSLGAVTPSPKPNPGPSPKPSPSPKPKNSKFGRNTGPEAEQQKKLRNKMLIFAEKVDTIRCSIDQLLPEVSFVSMSVHLLNRMHYMSPGLDQG
jgi:hypothetical protein